METCGDPRIYLMSLKSLVLIWRCFMMAIMWKHIEKYTDVANTLLDATHQMLLIVQMKAKENFGHVSTIKGNEQTIGST